MPSQRKLIERRKESSITRQFCATFSQKLTDQVCAFISGGMDRERHNAYRYLHQAGYIELWRATDYGRMPKETSNASHSTDFA